MLTSDVLDKISPALVAAQAQMKSIALNKTNPYFSSKYADLGAVLEVVKPVLASNGLAIIQSNVSWRDGGETLIGVTSRIIHTSGQWIEDTVTLPLLSAKNPAQTAGIYFTYLRRYALSAMLMLYAEEDDDGNGANVPKEVRKQSVMDTMDKTTKEIVDLIKLHGGSKNPQVVEILNNEGITSFTVKTIGSINDAEKANRIIKQLTELKGE